MGRAPKETFFQRRHTNGQQTDEKTLDITSSQRNANQNHNDIASHLSEKLSSCNQQISVGEDVEKREPWDTVGGNGLWYSHYGIEGMFLIKLKIELAYDPAISLLCIYPKKLEHYFKTIYAYLL